MGRVTVSVVELAGGGLVYFNLNYFITLSRFFYNFEREWNYLNF